MNALGAQWHPEHFVCQTCGKGFMGGTFFEFGGKPFPSTDKLTIPEYDNIAPQEDWTAGLPVVLRGIQNEDWNDLAQGIIISLEQVENYPKESGREDDPAKEWRNRTKRIAGAEEKVYEEWLPADLMAMAKRNVAK